METTQRMGNEMHLSAETLPLSSHTSVTQNFAFNYLLTALSGLARKVRPRALLQVFCYKAASSWSLVHAAGMAKLKFK
jgi:hypothetical protein